MRRTVISTPFYLICWVAIFVGCNGTNTVQLKVTTSNSTEIGNALEANQVTANIAFVVVAEISFEKAEGCHGHGNDLYFAGPFVNNLTDLGSVPSMDQIQIDPTKYCTFRYKFRPVDLYHLPKGADPIVLDSSVYVAGEAPDSTPYVVRIAEDLEYELRSKNTDEFIFNLDHVATLFLVFDINKLFKGIDWKYVDRIGGVKILIDTAHNKDAYNILKNNLQIFSSLVVDANNNNEVDDEDPVVENN